MGKNVYILTVTAGAGHLKCAEAIKKEFLNFYPEYDVSVVDILELCTTIFKKYYPKIYEEIVNKVPSLWGKVYDWTDSENFDNRFGKISAYLNKRSASGFIQAMKNKPPDLAICTHFLPPEILSFMARTVGIPFPFATVVTDFEAHRMYVNEGTGHYFVASELTAFQLTRRGVAASQISVTGIPVAPVFALHKQRESILSELKLDPQKKTLLIMSGGFGMGPVEKIVSVLHETDVPIQLLIIAGKNKRLVARLEEIQQKHPQKVFGFVDNVDELMTVSDLILTKPGGMTSSEALAKGLPMLILNAIPGQETRNRDYLIENGAAVSVSDVADIGFKIRELLNGDRLIKMKENVLKIARPNAAKDLIDKVIELYLSV